MSEGAIRKVVSNRPERTEDHGDEISRIREILFGELARDVDHGFADIGQGLVVTQPAIRTEFREKMTRIADTLDKQTERMDDMLGQEQVARENLLRDFSERLRPSASELARICHRGSWILACSQPLWRRSERNS